MMSAPDNDLQLLHIRLRLTEDALKDAVAGLQYIRQHHGELYGVGFDRVFKKADELQWGNQSKGRGGRAGPETMRAIDSLNHDYYGEAG